MCVVCALGEVWCSQGAEGSPLGLGMLTSGRQVAHRMLERKSGSNQQNFRTQDKGLRL
jgi:hypothetical protein